MVLGRMNKRCEKCKNAVIVKNYLYGYSYIECDLRPDPSDLSTEQLKHLIDNPEDTPCEFVPGKPKYGGVTYDD